ncbi:hypothetical protein [Legionella waltersii]|uniref:Ankyrin repeats (3 copies) n=1 Tax=Legionella waltersii TaxID=66969 RepID=A0A0W1A701_9GAMM|nr:hypothetical protein [Legionella waltersii]KTD77150.1 hypothetical protein Lwal_1927 [Legionella waltersii]SNV11450.1 Uncharacterised protein [Legionella waltersii]
MLETIKNLMIKILQEASVVMPLESFWPQNTTSIGKEKKDQITKLLQEASSLLKEECIAPHDYASVKQRMLELELQGELEYLTKLLEEPEHFAEEFLKSCQDRAKDDTHSLGFHQEPLSATNSLYWQIAELCFAPSTMQEMLSILLPTVRYRVAIRLSDYVTKQEMRENRHQPEIKLEEGLASLTQKPVHSELAHYVIAEGCLLDVRDVIHFPLGTHSLLRKSLLDGSPSSANPLVRLDKLVQPLLEHNEFFRGLKYDLDCYEHKGIIPMRALEQLIQGLLLGSTHMTRSEYANATATLAVQRFIEYLEGLPEKVQQDLRKSKGDFYSLDDVIKRELVKDSCVETAAGHLNKILKAQKTNPLWTKPAAISPIDLKKLHDKYNKHSEEKPTEKEECKLLSLPEQLLNQALQGIAPKNYSELVFLFLNFPTQWYGLLLTHLMPQKPQNVLTQAIRQGYFSPEQQQALVKAILKQLQKRDAANDGQAIFNWAQSTHDEGIIEQALEIIFLNELCRDQFYDQPLWHRLIKDHPLLLPSVFKRLPSNLLERMFKQKKEGYNALMLAVLHQPDAISDLLTVIEKFPQRTQEEIFTQTDDFGNNALMLAIPAHPEAIHRFIKLIKKLPQVTQTVIFKQVNDLSVNALMLAAKYRPNSILLFIAVIKKLPQETQDIISKQTDIDDNNSLMVAIRHQPSAIPDLLELIGKLSPETKETVFKQTNNRRNVLMLAALSQPSFISQFLEVIKTVPLETQNLIFTQQDEEGKTVMDYLSHQPQFQQRILKLFPNKVTYNARFFSDQGSSETRGKESSKEVSNHCTIV